MKMGQIATAEKAVAEVAAAAEALVVVGMVSEVPTRNQ